MHELLTQFDAALRHASGLRDQLTLHPRQSFAYNRLLQDVLAPYRAAVAKYAELGAAPPEDVVTAYNRVTIALSDELDRAENAPLVLRDQTILLDENEVFREDAPVRQVPPPAAPPNCCLTYIELENLYDGELNVKATNKDGMSIERDFTKSKPVRKLWKKPVPRDDDDEGQKAATAVIDGGLGPCVTLSIQIVTRDAHGSKVYQPMPPYQIEICCGDPNMVDGAVLNRPDPVQDHPHTVAKLPLLKIKKIVSMTPCPLETKGTGTSDHATVGSGVKALDGVRRVDRKIFYGVWGRFYAKSTTCKNLRFVQGVKRTVEAEYPGKASFERLDSMSRDDNFHVDILPGAPTPEYPSAPTADGGREMNDGPGVTNPWDGAVQIDDKRKPFPPGTKLRITWVFRTWLVCLDTQPVPILGRWDWTVVLHVTVGADQAGTHSSSDPVKPEWSDDPDKSGYEKVAGQATNSSAFLPSK